MTDSAQPRKITDDMPLSELTVGEFKQLMAQLLAKHSVAAASEGVLDAPLEPEVKIQHKSLDDFMSTLTDS